MTTRRKAPAAERKVRLTKTLIDQARHSGIAYQGDDGRPVHRREVLWDVDVPGLGLRLLPSGRKVWVLRWRSRGRRAFVRLAYYGDLTLDQARRAAQARFGQAALTGEEPIRRREGPVPTVAEFSAKVEEELDGRKALTATAYKLALRRLVDRIGRVEVDRIDEGVVRRALDAIQTDFGIGARNHSRIVLRVLLRLAREAGHIAKGATDPTAEVRYVNNQRRDVGRVLTDDEFARLAAALEQDAVEFPQPAAVAARTIVKLLAMTGARRREIALMLWKDVDLEARVIRLPDSKAGARAIALSPLAVVILRSIPRVDDRVFPDLGGRSMNHALGHVWERLRDRAGLGGVRLHDFRHTFVTRALEGSGSTALVGKAVGHASERTTALYFHRFAADPSVRGAIERPAEEIGAILEMRKPAEVRDISGE